MGSFFKTVFASCLGVAVAFFLGILILVGIGMSAGSSSKKGKPSKATVLEMSLDKLVPDLTNNAERGLGDTDDLVGLHDYVDAIEAAAKDKNVAGMMIWMENPMQFSGFSSAQSLRNAISAFKASGKFVYAYGDGYSRSQYYMASVADSVFMNPLGEVEFSGIAAVYPFFKELFDELGIVPQVYYAGKFKGATESFRLNGLSAENRLQIRGYVDTIYAHTLQDISVSRSISTDSLRGIANRGAFRTPYEAKALGLVDQVCYRDDVETLLRTKLKVKEKGILPKMDLSDYAQTLKKAAGSGKDKVAVVYCEGEIMGGTEAAAGQIIQEPYRLILKRLREDKDVKAIVLRINSGGGSALTSEVLHQEVVRARAAGIKVVVSMGDVAASGGYYMACAADTIFAESSTITGSIGVFAFIPGTQKMFEDKLHIHFDSVKTSNHATLFNSAYNHSESDKALLQNWVDSLYQTFIGRVATGRKMTKDQVHEIAQGRVWAAGDALRLGLVDRIGGLDDAIATAVRMAGLTKYKIKSYPTPPEPWAEFMKKFSGQAQVETQVKAELKQSLGPVYGPLADLNKLFSTTAPQMKMIWGLPK
jgi:protease IV